MDNIKFHTSLLPTFSGKQDHLESFIISIDEFYSLYYNNIDEQRRLVTAAIKSKLVDEARNFYLSRPDLVGWPEIKAGLRHKFGDPITYFVLMQQLQYFKLNRNETIMQFVDRLKTFVQRIVAKIQCEVIDPTSKATLLIQVENTSVLILTANSPQTLKTMLMIQRPTTLDDAVQCVVNYDMIESQVNFTNNNFPPTKDTSERLNNFKPNQNRTPPNTFRNYSLSSPPRNKTQPFPSQPIPIHSRPINRYYPTNAQVFGTPKPPLPNKGQEFPIPMSTSTAGPSRLYQQRQPSVRQQNHFVPTGPRNFVSQELTNVEVNPMLNTEPDQILKENHSNGNSSYNLDNSEELNEYDQECEPLQELGTNEENVENFPKLASYLGWT
ncbi:hypothetical protein ABEB36_014651 [Hypothenemus hampei]|uniref:Retrotransposon gag domain-containing protein n=1 Tax=Hypothenemus hampei TaxID=57062 RepID=A0ABD1E237_HYPHA